MMAFTRWEPINPAPPVTKITFKFLFLSSPFFLFRGQEWPHWEKFTAGGSFLYRFFQTLADFIGGNQIGFFPLCQSDMAIAKN